VIVAVCLTRLGCPQLLPLARAGFQGFIRAYATHSKETKHVFHVRGLHFGHIAKSFALREQPTLAVRAAMSPPARHMLTLLMRRRSHMNSRARAPVVIAQSSRAHPEGKDSEKATRGGGRKGDKNKGGRGKKGRSSSGTTVASKVGGGAKRKRSAALSNGLEDDAARAKAGGRAPSEPTQPKRARKAPNIKMLINSEFAD